MNNTNLNIGYKKDVDKDSMDNVKVACELAHVVVAIIEEHFGKEEVKKLLILLILGAAIILGIIWLIWAFGRTNE